MALTDQFFALFGVDQHNWDSMPVIEWTREHTEVPIFFVMAYLALIFQGPVVLQNFPPMRSKYIFAFWNFLLSTFSFFGMVNTVPVLLRYLQEKGFKYTVCTDPAEWYLRGPPGLYVFLFIYSKIPELMDTVFLVLRKREVIFLHWFHHCTVLLYCWHAYHNAIAPGLWFASMNYTVHSIMYLYYMVTILGLFRKLTKAIAPFITTIQILQMIMGMTVTYFSAVWHMEGGVEECYVTPSNYKLGLGMYTIYFVLFAILFKNLYLSGPKTQKKKEFCGASDAAGHFLPGDRQDGEDKKVN
eukprot:TRINITY_DN33628_c0_g1_i1.p1 TRINITY_DN33628_c0_g1~~TRINITY_DN33628_c0_g1_i1.p1  ORF type:complete len:322 (+),score=89.14 TRINITY_DN33628_c0_g1_i1:71-967(+)